LSLFDAAGRMVRSVTVPRGAVIATVDVAGLASGLYDIRLDNSVWSGKLAIEQ